MDPTNRYTPDVHLMASLDAPNDVYIHVCVCMSTIQIGIRLVLAKVVIHVHPSTEENKKL